MDDVAALLLGPVMGLALRINGFVCLHASAVVLKNSAIALMAPPGHGKSTLAAAFAKRGYPVLTDDILVLVNDENQLKIQPSYPQIRLLPEAVETLFGNHSALPRLSPKNPNLVKHVLHLTSPDYRFICEPVGLGAVYTGLENSQITSPTIRPLSGIECFISLCGNTYLSWVMDKEMQRDNFNALHQIANRIPVRCIETPDRNATTPFELCRLILDDFQKISNVLR